MKNMLFILLGLVFAINVSTAQDYNKLLKNASKNLGKFNLDPVTNADKLTEALALIDEAFESEEAKTSSKAWVTKGKIFNELASADINKRFISPTPIPMAQPKAALTAYESLMKAIEFAAKKSETKDALKALVETEGHLHNTGIFMYQDQNFADAFSNFDAEMTASETLIDNESESRLQDPAIMADQIYTTAVSGYYGKNFDGAKPYLEKLYASGEAESFVYEALFNMNLEADEATAIKYLDEGRAAYPADQGLMFAEINLYLKKGEIEGLVTKLEKAAEMEPENMSVALTLGSVYDQLSVASNAAGDEAKANDFFSKAKGTYEAIIAKEAQNFEATYSLGALYYNKAAAMTDGLNKLADDYSKAGTAKYNELKKQMDDLFNLAKPYFLTAEGINPTDGNTLIALKEIYARNNELDKSGEYKAKYEALGN